MATLVLPKAEPGSLSRRRSVGAKSMFWIAAGGATVIVLGATFAAGRASILPELVAARRAVRVDALTGVANRAGLLVELSRRARGRERYTLLMIDLDAFKTVNDRYGHDVGDQVLVEVAGRLSALVAGTGMVARLGGDEFVVVASPAFSELLGRDVVRSVARPIDIVGGPVELRVEVGASVGVVHAEPGVDAPALLRSADVAMYRAKKTRVGVFEYDMAPVADTDGLRPLVRLRDSAGAGSSQVSSLAAAVAA